MSMTDQAESEAVNLAITVRQCRGFEPQTWRRNLCKNCFMTAEQHDQNKKTGEEDEGTSKVIFAQPSDSDEEQELKTEHHKKEERDEAENQSKSLF